MVYAHLRLSTKPFMGSVTARERAEDSVEAANLGDDHWLFVQGSGASLDVLRESGRGKDVSIELDDGLHNLALQGSKALELLDAHASVDLPALVYFHHTDTELLRHR